MQKKHLNILPSKKQIRNESNSDDWLRDKGNTDRKIVLEVFKRLVLWDRENKPKTAPDKGGL